MDGQDIRKEELETIKAIYEDSAQIDFHNLSGSIKIPITLENDVLVQLSSREGGSLSTYVRYLPSIHLDFEFPEHYPYEAPPETKIRSQILDESKQTEITRNLTKLWSDSRDQVLFSMIDHIQQVSYDYVDSVQSKTMDCHGDQIFYDQIIAFDQEQRLESFNASTFTCEICQGDVKGEKCMQFSPCEHVFCRKCLRDFFTSLIESGDVEKVHCPDFECGKSALQIREKYLRLDFLTRDNFDFEEFKRNIMTPPIRLDTLQAVLGTESGGVSLFEKYIAIYNDHQHALIAKLFPMRLVTCPRDHCPAMIFRENTQDRLVVCRQCGYAFCNTCRKSFHSGSIDCSRTKDERVYHGIAVEDIELWISEGKSTPAGNQLRCRYGHELLRKVADEYTMDQMFNELLKEESHEFSTCPTCDIVIQRSEGCNKMRCSHCYTFFCHLCSAFLDQDHPYDHFKDKASTCYNRLFQGMPGTEDMEHFGVL
ncbi:hypothetical protein OXX79_006700 [Metschnikowia pulcherrima]